MEDNQFYTRYHRQLILPGFGMESQVKLKQAKVLVIGTGGLGCPVASSLVAMGVGQIGLVDDGLVELSNLHRQLLYGVDDVGKQKVLVAEQALKRLNPSVEIDSYAARMNTSNALDWIAPYDLIVDGTDNFESRYLINDACVLLGKTLVYGAVSTYEGQVAVFNKEVNYRDLFPHPPKIGEVLSCEEAGVLGILPGIIGNLMANECVKLLTGIGEALLGKMLIFNVLKNTSYVLEIAPTPLGAALVPDNMQVFENIDYEALCGVEAFSEQEIELRTLQDLCRQGGVDLVDIRELGELPELVDLPVIRMPWSGFDERSEELKAPIVVFICQTGQRSRRAAQHFSGQAQGRGKQVYSLKGGLGVLKSGNAAK